MKPIHIIQWCFHLTQFAMSLLSHLNVLTQLREHCAACPRGFGLDAAHVCSVLITIPSTSKQIIPHPVKSATEQTVSPLNWVTMWFRDVLRIQNAFSSLQLLSNECLQTLKMMLLFCWLSYVLLALIFMTKTKCHWKGFCNAGSSALKIGSLYVVVPPLLMQTWISQQLWERFVQRSTLETNDRHQRMNPSDFGDPLMLYLTSTWVCHLCISVRFVGTCWMWLWNLVQTVNLSNTIV